MELECINIIDAVQYAVNKIAKQYYKNDTDSPPKFTVSQYDKRNNEGKIVQHEIVLTVKHMGWVRTKTIFPRLDYKCGYESLKDEIMYLYNSTM